MKRMILSLAVCAAATTALAAPPYTDPQVIRTPTPQQVAEVYPKAALAKRTAGVATLRCLVLTTGRLSGCVALGENPPRLGFVEAALKLAPNFEYASATENEVPVEAQTDIEVRFEPPPKTLWQRYGVRTVLLTAWVAVIVAFVVRRRRRQSERMKAPAP